MREEDCSGMFMMKEGCTEEDYGGLKFTAETLQLGELSIVVAGWFMSICVYASITNTFSSSN